MTGVLALPLGDTPATGVENSAWPEFPKGAILLTSRDFFQFFTRI